MGPITLDPTGNFTDMEYGMIAALFQRLTERGMGPVVFYALNHDGHPCALFHSAFTRADVDAIGDKITEQLVEIQLNAAR